MILRLYNDFVAKCIVSCWGHFYLVRKYRYGPNYCSFEDAEKHEKVE